MSPPTCGSFLGHSAVGLHLCRGPPQALLLLSPGVNTLVPQRTEDVRKTSEQRVTLPHPPAVAAPCGFPHAQQFSVTPAPGPLIQSSSDAIYGECAADPKLRDMELLSPPQAATRLAEGVPAWKPESPRLRLGFPAPQRCRPGRRPKTRGVPSPTCDFARPAQGPRQPAQPRSRPGIFTLLGVSRLDQTPPNLMADVPRLYEPLCSLLC